MVRLANNLRETLFSRHKYSSCLNFDTSNHIVQCVMPKSDYMATIFCQVLQGNKIKNEILTKTGYIP